jgi:hypothetical protein
MSVSSILAVVTGFMSHYAEESAAVHAALTDIVNALPLQQQDKARVTATIDKLAAIPGNIESSLANILETPPHVTINLADVETALGAFFASPAGISAVAAFFASPAGLAALKNAVPAVTAPAPTFQPFQPAPETTDTSAAIASSLAGDPSSVTVA